jgi:hypothetical protein
MTGYCQPLTGDEFPNGLTATITSTPKPWNFCPNCGQKLEASWNHCPGCGVIIGQLAAPYVWPHPWVIPTQPWITWQQGVGLMPRTYGTTKVTAEPPITLL